MRKHTLSIAIIATAMLLVFLFLIAFTFTILQVPVGDFILYSIYVVSGEIVLAVIFTALFYFAGLILAPSAYKFAAEKSAIDPGLIEVSLAVTAIMVAISQQY